MPELPDVEVYREALAARVAGRTLERIELLNPFVLRTAVPPIETLHGRPVREVRRLGKRIVLGFDGALFLVIHLMIAGRLRWLAAGAKPPGRITLALFHFPPDRLALTEAGTKRRASLHLVQGEAGLMAFDMGGLEGLSAEFAAFDARLSSGNHTLKRALTDPRIMSGIGNAYSDEILFAARLSPVVQASALDEVERERLYRAVREVLGSAFAARRDVPPADLKAAKVAAMAVHGRTGEACPDSGGTILDVPGSKGAAQYCPECQTGGVPLPE